MSRRDLGRKPLAQKIGEAVHRPGLDPEAVERFVVAAILAASPGDRWGPDDRAVLTRYFDRYGIRLSPAPDLAARLAAHFEAHPVDPGLAREILEIIRRDKSEAVRAGAVDHARALVGATQIAFRPADPRAPRLAPHQLRAQTLPENPET